MRRTGVMQVLHFQKSIYVSKESLLGKLTLRQAMLRFEEFCISFRFAVKIYELTVRGSTFAISLVKPGSLLQKLGSPIERFHQTNEPDLRPGAAK